MSISALNWADYTIIALIAFSVLVSIFRGFVREALSLVSWIVAIWVAMSFCEPFAQILSGTINNEHIRIGVAFFSLFAISLILGAIVGFLLSQIIQKTGLGGTDRVLGIVFGAGRGTLVIGMLVLLAGLSQMPHEGWWQESQLIPAFQPLAMWLEGFLPEELPVQFS